MQRTITLYSRSGSALGNLTYPTSLATGEELAYYPGVVIQHPAQAKITRAGAGVTVNLKFQATRGAPNPLTIGAGAAAFDIWGLLVNSARIKLTQQTGASVALSHTYASGLLTLLLATDALGRPVTTGAAAVTYINANLPADFLASSGGAGILGETFQPCPVPLTARWMDIESRRDDTGTTAIEHTIDAGAGSTINVPLLVLNTLGWRAIRCVVTGTAAPNADDAAEVTMAIPGDRLEA